MKRCRNIRQPNLATACYLLGQSRRRRADVDRELLRSPRSQSSRSVLLVIRIDIIIGECITTPINLVVVNQTAVVVGRVGLVVLGSAYSRLNVAAGNQQGSSNKGSTQARNNGLVKLIVPSLDGKRPAVATPDVIGTWLAVAAVVAIALELAVLDLALDLAGRGLRVDGESVAGIVVPDFVDIRLPVILEAVLVDVAVVAWCQGAEKSSLGVPDAQIGPGEAVFGRLFSQVFANLTECVGVKTSGNLGASIRGAQAHAEDHANKVDVADVRPDSLSFGIGKLDEAPVDTRAGVLEVCRRRLYQAVASRDLDDEEGESAFGEVDASRRDDNGDSYCEGLALCRQRDLDLVADGDGDLGASGAGIQEAAIALDEDDPVLRVETSNVRIDVTAAEAVDEFDREMPRLGIGLVGEFVGAGCCWAVVCAVEDVVPRDGDVVDASGAGDGEGGCNSCDERGGCRYCAHEGSEESESTHDAVCVLSAKRKS